MTDDILIRLRRQPEDINGQSRMDMLRERIEAVEEIERLRAALQPFADEANAQDQRNPHAFDNMPTVRKFTIGECRAARAALAKKVPQQGIAAEVDQQDPDEPTSAMTPH